MKSKEKVDPHHSCSRSRSVPHLIQTNRTSMRSSSEADSASSTGVIVV